MKNIKLDVRVREEETQGFSTGLKKTAFWKQLKRACVYVSNVTVLKKSK